jgi:hypothetical protein
VHGGEQKTWGRTRVGDQHSTPLSLSAQTSNPFFCVVSLVLITQAVEYGSIRVWRRETRVFCFSSPQITFSPVVGRNGGKDEKL